ncbi:MAG: alpha/beta hydrolase, partial [Pseudomonadota bacterium]
AELVALERELPDMTVPIYIIHGSADDLVPIENLPFMKKHLPAEQVCAVTVIEDQNHFLPWNEIEAFWAMALKAAEDEPGRC